MKLEENIGRLCIGSENEEALLVQLMESIDNSFDTGTSGSTGSKSKAPLALSSMSLYDDVEKEAKNIIPGRYFGLVERILSVLSTPLEDRERRRLECWTTSVIERIEGMFDPVKYLEIVEPCPVCGVTKYFHADGENTRVGYSLRAWNDAAGGSNAECQECGASWLGLSEVLKLSRAVLRQAA